MQAAEVSCLVQAHGAELYHFCRRLACCGQDADDLYQQTFLRLLEMELAVDQGQNPRALLFSVASGLWKNEARKRGRRSAIARPLELDADAPPPLAAPDDPAREAADGAEQAALRAAVSALPPKLQVPVVLAYGFDVPLAQIAQIEKTPQGTVKSRLHKARQLLKKRMEAQGYGKTE